MCVNPPAAKTNMTVQSAGRIITQQAAGGGLGSTAMILSSSSLVFSFSLPSPPLSFFSCLFLFVFFPFLLYFHFFSFSLSFLSPVFFSLPPFLFSFLSFIDKLQGNSVLLFLPNLKSLMVRSGAVGALASLT